MIESKEEGEELRKNILEFKASNNQFIKRVDHQYLLSGNINKLGREISNLKNKCRQQLDDASGIKTYENRLSLLRNKIDSILDTSVDDIGRSALRNQNLEIDLDNELRILCNSNVRNSDINSFQKCSKCQKYVLSEMIAMHNGQCYESAVLPTCSYSKDANYEKSPVELVTEEAHANTNSYGAETINKNNDEITAANEDEHSKSLHISYEKKITESNLLLSNLDRKGPEKRNYQPTKNRNSRRVYFADKKEQNEARNDNLEYENEHDFIKRRDQYEFRINAIENEIASNETIVTEITVACTFSILKSANMQQRILTLQHELNRVSSLKGNFNNVSSDVLHGSKQTFHTLQQLKQELNLELETVQTNLANLKRGLIKDNKTKARLMDLIKKKKLQLKERKDAFSSFEVEHRSNRSLRYGFQSKSKLETLMNIFDCWKRMTRRKIKIKNIILKLKICKAVIKWKTFISDESSKLHVESHKNDEMKGLGCYLLRATERQVLDNLDNFQVLLHEVSGISHQNQDMQNFDESLCQMDITRFLPKIDIEDMSCEVCVKMMKGDRLTKMNQHQDALLWYDHALKLVPEPEERTASKNGTGNSSRDLFLYVLLYGRMANCELKLNSLNRALYFYEKQLYVLKKTNCCDSAFVPAYLCLAKCYVELKSFSQAVVWYTKALSVCYDDKASCDIDSFSNVVLNRFKILSCKGLSACYNKLNHFHSAQKYDAMVIDIINGKKEKMMLGIKATEEIESSIVSISATYESLVKLELITGHLVSLKIDKSKLECRLSALEQKLSIFQEESSEIRTLIEKIEQQYNDAVTTNKDNFESSLIHAKTTQKFDVSELLMRLREKKKIYNSQLQENEEKEDELKTEIDDMLYNINSIKEEIRVENGPLVRKILNERRFRCMAQNKSNIFNNEITGENNTDVGVPYIAASESSDLFVYSIKTGEMKCSFLGDKEGSNANEGPMGHTSLITAIHFRDMRIYTGSMDKYVMCWDVEQNERVFKASGHEGTVTCITVDDIKMLTGSADKKIGLWNKNTGVLIRFIEGHSRGIICIDSGTNWCLSGGSDGVVFVWQQEQQQCTRELAQENITLKCKQRLKVKSSEVMITVARYGKLEIVSGDSTGSVIVWWIENGEVLQNFKAAHDGKVMDLQFDATKIISSGYDSKIQIMSIMTGAIIQTLDGHQSSVASVAFDSVRVLSLSLDGVSIQWQLGNFGRVEDDTNRGAKNTAKDQLLSNNDKKEKTSRRARNERKVRKHNRLVDDNLSKSNKPGRARNSNLRNNEANEKSIEVGKRSEQSTLASRLQSVKEVRFNV